VHQPEIKLLKIHYKSNRLLLVIMLLCTSWFSFAQLPAFTLNVTKTEENCPGNGTLTFTSLNTDPAASVIYTIYELPDTTTAIAVLSTNFLGGLTHGTYRVIATETLGADSNTQSQDITINDQLIALAYTTSGTDITCNDNGTITVSVYQGNGVSYEIISGPVIRAPQASPTFTSLPAGVYQIRVFDNCGEGWVAAHTLFNNAGGMTVTPVDSDEEELVTCDSVTIINTITPALNTLLSYPISIQYTVYPPGGGAPIVTNSTMASGDISELEIRTVIPYYSNSVYSYTLIITDACGKVYQSGSTAVSKPFLVMPRLFNARCGGHFLKFVASNFKAPLTINFTSAPAGFNPVAFNPQHPGPYPDGNVIYGDALNPLPFGHYTATVTDACGKSVTVNITLEDIPVVPSVNMTPGNGCNSDTSLVNIAVQGFPIVTGTVTIAPIAYSTALPLNVSSFVNAQGQLEIPNMPTGNYHVTLIDECGNTYEVDFFVLGLHTEVTSATRPGCGNGNGGVMIRGNFTTLVSAAIISAPPTYSATLPHDVSFNILFGIFYMSELPAGDYVINVTDNCGIAHPVNITVEGYAVTINDYNIVEHCGSFDLYFAHACNNTVAAQSFYLQKYDPVTGNWGHPQTGVPNLPGDPPTTANGYPLTNNFMNYNISYLGTFRIIKRFESFENGSIGDYKTCVEVIQEFTFTNTVRITDIRKTTCNGTSSDVNVTAIGIPPLTYEITSQNGLPYAINNGTNPVFPNLSPAIYNFLVKDACGNIVNRLTDVAALPSLVIANHAPDMIECDDDNDGKGNFDFDAQTPIILGTQTPSDYIVSYHLSSADASADINPLPIPYVSGNNTIYCRLEYKTSPNCYDITSFDIIVNPYPQLQMDQYAVVCAGKDVMLIADAGFNSYLWSTGETTRSIIIDQPGNYTLEVTQLNNGILCSALYNIEVAPSAPAVIEQVITTDWTNDENTISVILDSPVSANYSYSLDNIHFQTNNTFYGLAAGEYTVYVKDENGCGTTDHDVVLLTYPKFFTPNGDGYNDYWQVQFANFEPHIKIYIFDRYGKLLTGFGASSPGWDGRYNDEQMPSTDYWFLVVRENGKEYRGHFAMKR
jgi:gliding motility-associated-like protein